MSKPAPRCLIGKVHRVADRCEPVNDFIESEKSAVQLALDRLIDRINSLGESCPHLAYPHRSQIEGELGELRGHYGKLLYRIRICESEGELSPFYSGLLAK